MRWIVVITLLVCVVPVGAEERPNILFLFADDQRPDAVGAFGNPHLKTPHIDEIVKSGYRFENNYCLGSTGGAVCLPSRAMLMSGRTLFRVRGNLQGTPTLGEVLRGSGYATFGTGKWHNGGPSFLRTFERGEAVMIGGMSNHLKVPIREIGSDGKLTKPTIGDGFSSELFADAAIRFLESVADSEQPFFAYVSFTAPHDPRQPPEKYRQMYYDARPPLPKNYMPQHPFHNGWMTGRDEVLAAWPRTEDVISDQLCEYYGLITHMDDQIGRILAALERTGRAEKTIVIFSADHGLAVGSHGLLGKQSVYEHSMGCPLVISGPGIPHGSSQALSYLLDLMPTLCDYAGVKPPEGVEGKSLRPVMEGTAQSVRDTAYLIYENKMRAVRNDRYKLIRYPLIDHEQLFDLEEDPDELVNLIAEADRAELAAELRSELAEWHEKLDDPHPLSVAEPKSKEIDLAGRARKPDRHQPGWIIGKYFDPLAVDQKLLDDLAPRVMSRFEKKIGKLPEGLKFRIASALEIEEALYPEVLAQYRSFQEEEAAQQNARTFATLISDTLLAKYHFDENTVLVNPATFTSTAEVLEMPQLRTREAVAAMLVHECGHAYSDATFDMDDTLTSRASADGLEAFDAVVEGYAQFIARKVCRGGNWETGFETFTKSIGALPPGDGDDEATRYMMRILVTSAASAYYDGERFVAAVHAAGGDEAVAGLFRSPPKSMEEILHPEWYIDPEKRPAVAYELEAAVETFRTDYPENEWTAQLITITRPQLQAAFSMLPADEVDEVVDLVRQNRATVIQPTAAPGTQLIVGCVYECASAQAATEYLAASERLSKIKDEKMAVGINRITKSHKEAVEAETWRGLYFEKTVHAGIQAVPVKSIIAVRGALVVELLFSVAETDRANLEKMTTRAFAATVPTKP